MQNFYIFASYFLEIYKITTGAIDICSWSRFVNYK